ncbi:hypothetical protein [Microbulbifer discodermiae]|uniref:hypothetical protein n=1 Tax=Microbulbifer sp. 2201CG32-9 TaxID=3232309 RepID=UPI00345BC222
MYVYKKMESELWTVGFYTPDGQWEPESDHSSQEDAANRAAFLNGGSPEKQEKPKTKHYYLQLDNNPLFVSGPETAIIILGYSPTYEDNSLRLILKGDHYKELSKLSDNGGFEACLAYFEEHIDQASPYSEHHIPANRKIITRVKDDFGSR